MNRFNDKFKQVRERIGNLDGIKDDIDEVLENAFPETSPELGKQLTSADFRSFIDDEFETRPDLRVPETPVKIYDHLPGISKERGARSLGHAVELGLVMKKRYMTEVEIAAEKMRNAPLEKRLEVAVNIYHSRRKGSEKYVSVRDIVKKCDVSEYALRKEVVKRRIELRNPTPIVRTTLDEREDRRCKVADYMLDCTGSVNELAEILHCSPATIYHDMSVIRFRESEKRDAFYEAHEHSKTTKDSEYLPLRLMQRG